MLNKPVSLVLTSSQTGSLQKPLLPDSLALTQNLYRVNGYRPGISFVNSVSPFEFMVHFETCLPIVSSKLINSCQTKPQRYFDVYWFQKKHFHLISNYIHLKRLDGHQITHQIYTLNLLI